MLPFPGELDDHLLPVGKELIRYEDEENEWEEAEALGQARPGSAKRKQYYFKKVNISGTTGLGKRTAIL